MRYSGIIRMRNVALCIPIAQGWKWHEARKEQAEKKLFCVDTNRSKQWRNAEWQFANRGSVRESAGNISHFFCIRTGMGSGKASAGVTFYPTSPRVCLAVWHTRSAHSTHLGRKSAFNNSTEPSEWMAGACFGGACAATANVDGIGHVIWRCGFVHGDAHTWRREELLAVAFSSAVIWYDSSHANSQTHCQRHFEAHSFYGGFYILSCYIFSVLDFRFWYCIYFGSATLRWCQRATLIAQFLRISITFSTFVHHYPAS